RETFDSTSYVEAWESYNGVPPFNHPTKNVNLNSYLSNLKIAIQPNEQCWKDTIIVNAGEVVTIRVRFAQQDGSSFPFDATAGPGYVWHCHLLEHEDNEMMRPYKVTPKGSSIALPLAVSTVGIAAAAAVIGYSYSRKRKKRQRTIKGLVVQHDHLPALSDVKKLEKNEAELEDYKPN
ncbi:MAG TPA: multicopper oxidase domain-containing protein, partial [Candidatus Acidoferrum sp.]|nr:multicopper oxidase domain-containing protein [Candidatus Acidoferrum sp.]